jgi:hypothetical protein
MIQSAAEELGSCRHDEHVGVRDEHWESRLPYERDAEIEQLLGAPNHQG